MILIEVREAVVEEDWRFHGIWDIESEDALCGVLNHSVYDAGRHILICGGDNPPAPCRGI